ncbi:MAG: hypothetical protein LBV12_01455 [Puniceicoccales bacterium]|jgi:hypothetical protein|nr:hypothetical protein [Puniceicoccales bacterium]
MRASFKFFRVNSRNIASIAIVSVDVVESNQYRIVWQEKALSLKKIYGDAVLKGINAAIEQHTMLGGGIVCISVVEIIEFYADTSSDSVMCASALATWKALGYGEESTKIVYENGWTVTFT